MFEGYYCLLSLDCDSVEVERNIMELKIKFQELQMAVMKSLLHEGIPITDIIREVTELPASEVAEHERYIPEEEIKELDKCMQYDVLFSRLNPHWNYLSPNFLYHLIVTFLKTIEEMVTYNTDLSQFRSQTLVRLFAQTNQQEIQLQEGFSSMILARFEEGVPEDMTLQHVEDFRMKYSKHHKLCEFALLLIPNLKAAPFSVPFCVPKAVTKRLKHNVPTNLFKEFGITGFEIAGTPVYGDAGVNVSLTSEYSLSSASPQPPSAVLVHSGKAGIC